jgi:hypothetical protein
LPIFEKINLGKLSPQFGLTSFGSNFWQFGIFVIDTTSKIGKKEIPSFNM